MNKKHLLLTTYLLLMSNKEHTLNDFIKENNDKFTVHELFYFIKQLQRNGYILLTENYTFAISDLFDSEIAIILKEISADILFDMPNIEIFNFLKKYLIAKNIELNDVCYGHKGRVNIDISMILSEIGDRGYEYITITNEVPMQLNNSCNNEVNSQSKCHYGSSKHLIFTGVNLINI